MSDAPRSFIIKYDVHCQFENHFGKEMIVKNCLSKVHAKLKLGAYCEKHYGKEFEFIKFISVEEYNKFNDIFDSFSDLFGAAKCKEDDSIVDFLQKLKNKKKS